VIYLEVIYQQSIDWAGSSKKQGTSSDVARGKVLIQLLTSIRGDISAVDRLGE
jgi:hypothetical protein